MLTIKSLKLTSKSLNLRVIGGGGGGGRLIR